MRCLRILKFRTFLKCLNQSSILSWKINFLSEFKIDLFPEFTLVHSVHVILLNVSQTHHLISVNDFDDLNNEWDVNIEINSWIFIMIFYYLIECCKIIVFSFLIRLKRNQILCLLGRDGEMTTNNDGAFFCLYNYLAMNLERVIHIFPCFVQHMEV